MSVGGRIDAAGLADWLLRQGRSYPDAASFVADLGARLIASGFPIWRLTLFVPENHPYIQGRTYEWFDGSNQAREIEIERAMRMTRLFHHSPIGLAIRTGKAVRRRLTRPEDLDFEIFEEFVAKGATDYLAEPMMLEDERHWAIATFVTRAAGGFSDAMLGAFDAIMPALSAVAEIYGKRQDVTDLLRTYLGRTSADQVQRGAISLGGGHTIRAVIWFCDMRDFTSLSEQLDRDETLDLLSDYFACMVGAVEAGAGDVLKFMGDGLLAAFPYNAVTGAAAAGRALASAQKARADLAAVNERRVTAGQPSIAAGIALHAGQVTAGNIGSRDRLDFTLVGPAVNLAARLEGLGKRLGEPIVASDAFATLYGAALRPLGEHALRGIAAPQAAWAVP